MNPCAKCGNVWSWTGKQYQGTSEDYDGTSEWICNQCGTRWGRWTGRELKGDDIEPRHGRGVIHTSESALAVAELPVGQTVPGMIYRREFSLTPHGSLGVDGDTRVDVGREEDGRWIAERIDVPGAMAYGATRDEAIANANRIAESTKSDQD